MIELKRLNGDAFTLNAVMIEHIQSYPDTTITLINGKKMVVKNSEDDVRELVIQFYRKAGLLGSLYEVGEVDE